MKNQEITDAQQTETSDEDVIRTGTPAEIEEGLNDWKLSLKEDPNIIIRIFQKVLSLFKSGKSISDIVNTLSDDTETNAIYAEVMQGVDDFHNTVDAFRKADNENKSYGTVIQEIIDEQLPEEVAEEDKKKILRAVNEQLDRRLVKSSEEIEQTMETADEMNKRTE